ncbi:universal stress protein [Streptomyces sp. NA02950]|uniref:universal stress protein n=1 Tax=Streptomyces sp. NA02950 TaxID=2742137 RepID=UPI0015905ECC|nr:universal stress protein [Streptomyces sp. NA02950]QKV91401.1 universal stress protein [Streptomyces sp. NA02950]
MELPVVVGVDGSDTASGALDWAAGMAALRGIPLRIVHASLWERYEGCLPASAADRPAERLRGETVLATAAERAGRRTPELEVMTDLVTDDPVSALLRAGQSAEAVVVGWRGRGEFASLLLGSVGLGIAARAHCPVVVVRGRAESAPGGTHRVVVGIAERERPGGPGPVPSPFLSPAVAFALREARLRGCDLEAVHAWRCAGPADHGPRAMYDTAYGGAQGAVHGLVHGGALGATYGAMRGGERADRGARRERNAARDDHDGRADHAQHAAGLLAEALGGATGQPLVPVTHRAVEATARKALLDASARADLLVVGARRRQGHFGMQLGPVNHAVLHHAHCPVAVVPRS